MPRFIEVSHPIEPGMKTYRGLPLPETKIIMDYDASRLRYGGQSEFLIASLHLCGNTGTYVDSPRHRYRDGVDLASLPLDSLAHLPVSKLDARAREGRAIDATFFRDVDLGGKAVLINTGWNRYWRTELYLDQHPFLTRDASELLVATGARFVGIDSPNIDDSHDPSRPAHTLLLGAGIPICEHMTMLEQLEPGGFLHAVPIAWMGGASFPVRAYVVYL